MCLIARAWGATSEMGVRNWRRAVQSAVGCLLLAYGTLLLYQARVSVNVKREPVLVSRVHQGQLSGAVLPMVVVTPPPPATATPKPQNTTINDIYISVKTTRHYHDERLDIILKTWFQLARDQIWFFTDTDSKTYQNRTNFHMINTHCPSSHNRKDLNCKMAVEFDVFLESGKKWFCHFDDDNYVNVPRLVSLLQDYNPKLDWYLGKPSIKEPMKIVSRDKSKKKISFWFATGGAGFCISQALASKMMPLAGGGKFISIGEKIKLTDDVTMGYIIEHLIGTPLTVVDQFHSHLEPMRLLKRESFHDQVSFSFAKRKDKWNVVDVDGFDEALDRNRFLSLHCFLFPYVSFCPR